MELDEYAREGIDGSQITYKDNQPVLEMLLGKPIGVLAICDEEALFPKVSFLLLVFLLLLLV
jgi:myosin-3